MAQAQHHPLLDAESFPDIIDEIILQSPRSVQHAFRSASTAYRDRVDSLLCRHIAISTEQLLIVVQTLNGAKVPCIRCESPGGERIPGLRWNAFEPDERARFLSLLAHVRRLDLGNFPQILTQLDRPIIQALCNVNSVRCHGLLRKPVSFPFAFRELRCAITLQCQADMWGGGMRWRQPPIAEGVVECADSVSAVRKLHVDVWFDPEEPGLPSARVHLHHPESVTDVVVRFRALDPGDLKRSRDAVPSALEMGMLTDVLALAVDGLPRVRWTVVVDETEVRGEWLGLPDGEEIGEAVVEFVQRGLERRGEERAIKLFTCWVDGRDP